MGAAATVVYKCLASIKSVLCQALPQLLVRLHKLTTMGYVHSVEIDPSKGLLFKELVKSRGFIVEDNRKHLTFPRVRNVLHSKTKDELMTWILTKLAPQLAAVQ